MMNLFDKVKVLCAFVVMGLGLAAYSAAPTVISVTAQQRYPWNGLVDIAVTFNGEQGEVAKANCTFAATNSATKAALAIAHVTPQGDATGSVTTWTRRFVWDANADVGEVKIDDVELFANVEAVAEELEDLGGVQLWEGGPYWAECNLGASKPEESGLYYMWGETEGHSGYWDFVGASCPAWNKSDFELRSMGYIDPTGVLSLAHDAAQAELGESWRMPTDEEFLELISNCTWEFATRNGVNGMRVTGKDDYASKSIFLPASGYGYYSRTRGYILDSFDSYGFYWSSKSNADSPYYGLCLSFNTVDFGLNNEHSRYLGQSVRPVRGLSK